MKPSQLLGKLSVPGTDKPLKLVVTELAGDEPWSGWVEDESGQMVGILDRFRFEFVQFRPLSSIERSELRRQPPRQVRERTKSFLSPFSDRVQWRGEAQVINDFLKGLTGYDLESRILFESCAPVVELALHAHGWSGFAWIAVNGEVIKEIDLFNRENAIQKRVKIDNPDLQNLLIEIGPVGKANSEAQSRQVILEGIFEYGHEFETPVYRKASARNRGGDFHYKFFELLDGLREDAIALDVGGGKRQIDDPRYINLEYSRFEEPDILGDGTKLPFPSNSIDLVYTAAVLEHVRDPLAMGREIYRIVRPGGIVLANSAFMQPIHSEGQHFFNLTPYGIELVFEQFVNKEVWSDVSFAFSMKWMVDVLNVRGQVSEEKIKKFIELAEDIERHIPFDRGKYVASGVWLLGIKQ